MAQKPENRVHLFRLQILIIDGGLLVFRNIIDHNLTAKGITLSTCLNNEMTTIKKLKGQNIITQVQYEQLFPTNGQNPTTSDMDLTLIIFLLRSLKCFGLNKTFVWKATPLPTDVSIEADICRFKAYRNEICHRAQTTDIQANEFVTLWNDIEQILVRLSSPALNIQQTIADYKICKLDPEEEKRVQEEIKKWKDYEADVDRLKEEMADVKVKVTEVGKTQEEIKRRLDEEKNNEGVSSLLTEEEQYQKRIEGALAALERKKTFQNDGNVVITSIWVLKSSEVDERTLHLFDEMFEAIVKGRKECFREEYAYKVFQEKVGDLMSYIKQTTGAKANDAEMSCVIVKFNCRTNKHIKNILEYFNSDDLKYRLNEIANVISRHAQIQVHLSFRITDESLDSILLEKAAGTEIDSHMHLTEETYLNRKNV